MPASSKSSSSDENDDTRSELKFDRGRETPAEKDKRKEIETALSKSSTSLKTWKDFAIGPYGLVGDDLRHQVWPMLLKVDTKNLKKPPKLAELSSHKEYDQVVLDVNRALKRFPPGIPYKQRLALQDQLTVLILRVIIKHPNLHYYQGYHDVAITFLLVAGEALAFNIMERLSTDHFKECMEPTMEKTSYRLTFIYPLLQKVDPDLYDYLESGSVGTIFALPWYLTWFGHSLNKYKDVVRLYDYFLASPPLLPLYVAASLVVERRAEIFEEECDMSMLLPLLGTIPDSLDFEPILERATQYYKTFPPSSLESEVKKRIKREAEMRRQENLRNPRGVNRNNNNSQSLWIRFSNNIPPWLLGRTQFGLLFATATILVGYYAYLQTTNPRWSFFGLFRT